MTDQTANVDYHDQVQSILESLRAIDPSYDPVFEWARDSGAPSLGEGTAPADCVPFRTMYPCRVVAPYDPWAGRPEVARRLDERRRNRRLRRSLS